MHGRKLRILFSGMMAGDPFQGGATWAVLQYILGLRALGHEVCFVEPIKPSSLKPPGSNLAASRNAAYFLEVVEVFGLRETAALIHEDTGVTVGLSRADIAAFARQADVLFNISGMLTDPELIAEIPIRVYLDLDPAFVQLWHAVEGIDMRFDRHTHFVTVGQAIGTPSCRIPPCGRSWIGTVPPVVLDYWPARGPDQPFALDALTTIANWRGYGSVHHNGVHYGQKAHSLRALIDLPKRTSQRFSLALAIDPGEIKDVAALEANGWSCVDPQTCCGTPADYQRFIQRSKGEFGIAKSGYVVSDCGWFSDRSACYLASGRPVVAQDTGFSRHLPTGNGLFAFSTADEALAAIEQLNRNYAQHCAAARRTAEEHFDAKRVLNRLIQQVEAS